MFDSLKLSDFSEKQCGILRMASSTRPMIWIVEENGVRAVVKDFNRNKFIFRNSIGRFLLWREAKAYRRLKNIRGTPALFKIVDGMAIVLEKIPGRNLENLEHGTGLPDNFFADLKDLVDSFHKRGLAHCDLKRAPNFILGHDGLPYIIDWGASISESEFKFFPLNRIYQRFVMDDYMAIIKLKMRHAPEEVTPEERARYNRRSKAEILVRTVRDRLRDFLQKVA
ncbi:MAG: hypothetical protein U9N82_09220 [Thermodesulfobacteriota bacterium]|nr:hypothetical protein [Thermodesulfobacteriota bacterium]